MEQSLMERFADPALFESLSMGEKAMGAGITTLMGMGITFIVLLLLWAVIAIMSKAMTSVNKPTVQAAPTAAAEAPKAAAVQEADNSELIAVISAAIAAYEGTSSLAASNLVVKKISRAGGESTAWGKAGMADCVDSRKIY